MFTYRCMTASMLMASAMASMAGAQTYTLVDLGSGDGGSAAWAIGDSGVVAGMSSFGSDKNRFHATAWDGSFNDLGVLAPWDQTTAFAVDGAGNIWGSAYSFATMTSMAVVSSGSGLISAGSFSPRGANAGGDVVGSMQVHTGALVVDHACLFHAGALTDLGTLGGDFSHATAINSTGWIVGSATTVKNVQTHAVLWKGGVIVDLGTLGGTRSRATAINGNRVCGVADTAGGSPHACLWTLDALGNVQTKTDLGVLGGDNSAGNGIDSAGTVVGMSDGRATIWHGGIAKELQTLAAPAAGWQLQTATAIDSRGRIVGTGWFYGYPRAYMLVCRADFDGSGFIDTEDFDAFVHAFEQGDPSADYDGSGFVDTDDFDAFVHAFEAGC